MVMMEIELKRSVLLMMLILAMGLLGAVSIALAQLVLAVQWILTTCLLAAISLGVWQARQALPGLRLQPNGQLQASMNADWHYAEVLPGSFVSPGLIIVRLRTAEGRRHRLTLLPDSASPEALRRLRVSLRWASRTRLDTASPDAG